MSGGFRIRTGTPYNKRESGAMFISPHPNPLPEGEGTLATPSRGRGDHSFETRATSHESATRFSPSRVPLSSKND